MSTRCPPETLKKLVNALVDVSDWRTLGIQLEVDYSTLDRIEQEYPKMVDRMSKMLHAWILKKPDATWDDIVTALRDMNLNSIAKNIEAKYCCSTQPQHSDISPPTSTTPLVPATQSLPPPLVTSPGGTPTLPESTPILPESTPLIADSPGGSPTSLSAVHEVASQSMPPPLVADSQISLPVAATTPLVRTSTPPIVNSQISPPPTSEGMATLMDTENPQEDRMQVVEKEIHELESKFRNLVLNAGEYLTKKESTPGFLSKFRINLVLLPASQREQHLRFFEKNRRDIFSASSVEEIFFILGYYWNWWNYSLLQHIIDSFGSKQLKSDLRCYLKDLKQFQKKTAFKDFIRACHSYLGVPPEFSEVRTRMKGDWLMYTVYQIREINQELVDSSSLEPFFVGVSHNSIVLIWAVPSTAVHILAAAIDEEFLQSNEIESVTIDGKDLSSYQSQDRQTPSKPVDPQDLHKACVEGNVELTLDLLDAGVDVETRDPDMFEMTPLARACADGRLDIVHLLLCFNANVNARDKNDNTPLMEACHEGHVDIVHALVEAHADLNAHDISGNTPLIWACIKGQVDIVHALVEAHADLNAHNNNGNTPLMLACNNGHVDIVHALVEAHADLNAHYSDEWTALSLASCEGHTEVVRILLTVGTQIDAQDKYYRMTALMWASRNGHSSTVRELLDGGAGMNLQDRHGWTALFHACWDGRTEVVRELLQGQADVNIPLESGITPLIIATKLGRSEVVELLLSSGKVDTEIQEQETDWTALHIAANDGKIDLVRLLLQHGANPSARDKHGLTALDIAQEGGHTAVFEELHKYVHPQTTTDQDPSCEDPRSQKEPISPDSQDPKSQQEPISPDSQDPKSQPEPISPPDSQDPKSQPEPISLGSQDPKSQPISQDPKSQPRSGREHRSSSRDSNRSKTTTQRWVQEARRRLKALFKRLEDQLLSSKTEKSRIITGPEDPGHQEHSVKKKGVIPPQEVAETTSVH